ncbi:apoptosis facilitator Bcl-2-like protein 14 [Seriola lalandi dorsalis]|uniref:apoptosis facilitator Bcl-2-like protein 14 n=1 Tax=Seriola lalandi dorsalis TaxID=1841481 RepID=UPI000C6F600A|nr:apoptosis facilitator Bcl-2-like protein 14 [Seriola lalandi dorsalis]XP_056244296.1 apoptosis facilitator Bcl-2-like protein 14 [Seriola aureovittata]XP_056244297.1 apoptosis facilitator Bcl-2-like protein 14 [Seriola aureovittata]
MASGSAAGEDSEVLLLLEEYCFKRSWQRSTGRSQRRLMSGGGAARLEGGGDNTAPSFFSTILKVQARKGFSNQGGWEADSTEEKHDASQTRSVAVERLVQITQSAPVPEVYVESQDEIIQRLVALMMAFGDDIDKKIQQSPVLQQQLCNMNYDLFEKLTYSVQKLVNRPGRAAASEERIQQQKIAWAFEVTSRLSAVGVVQRRRVLSFGDRYIQQHHAAWVQQHGGWDEVFAVD